MGKDRTPKAASEEPAPAAAVRRKPAILKSGNASSKQDPSTAQPSQNAVFGNWTGKTPLSLLYEACQKRGWERPEINPRKGKGASGFTGEVILRRKKNAKDTSADRVRLSPLPDQPVAIDRPTAAEAKHWAAAYALFRFANNQSLRMVLPPAIRDYWVMLEEEKKKTPEGLAWLWATDPFAAAAEQEQKKEQKQVRAAAKEKAEQSGQPVEKTSKYWSYAPQVHMAEHLRQLVETTVRDVLVSDAQPTAGPSKVDPTLAPYLQKMGFRARYIDSTIAHLQSDVGQRFSLGMDEREAALAWLQVITPEDDLPPSLRTRKPAETTIRNATSGSTKELASNWVAESLHSDGFPLSAAKRAVEMAAGDRGLALDLLLRQLTFLDDPQLTQEALLRDTKQDTAEAQRERASLRDEEATILESIWADDLSRPQPDVVELALGRSISLVWSLHAKSLYPSTAHGLPCVVIRSTALPAYLRLHLTRLALRFLRDDPTVADMLASGTGNVVGEAALHIKELLKTTLDHPPDSVEVMSPFAPAVKPLQINGTAPASRPPSQKGSKRSATMASTTTATLTTSVARLHAAMLQSPAYAKMLEQRKKLPAWSMREELVGAIRQGRVLLVAGETGSGKTTQTPAFVLEEELAAGRACNIVVTQPRRVSAISVAERVAQEHDQQIGRGLIGYAIRGERKASAETRLLFCTTGVLLRRMATGDSDLKSITHVFVDEVHERSIDGDVLLLELKHLLKRNETIKVVLMSATVQEQTFASYLDAQVVHIPGRTHPVQDVWLEDIISHSSYRPQQRGGLAKVSGEHLDKMRAAFSQRGVVDGTAIEALCTVTRSPTLDYGLVGAAVRLVVERHPDPGDAILVFCSGVQEIRMAMEAVRSAVSGYPLDLLPLHANLPPVEQAKVFRPPRKGCRKIVIATNVAETSITIDDVVHVVDCGLVKETSLDATTGVSRLAEVRVSKASAKQRRGRAGRTRPGHCWHIYDESWTWRNMTEQSLPEILRTPLEQVLLRLLAAHPDDDPRALLQQAISPPDTATVDAAQVILRNLGALEEVEGNIRLTGLGQQLSMLPVDVRLGKMLVLGSLLGCVDPLLSIAAVLSSKPLFLASPDKRDQAAEARKRSAVDDSDLLTDGAAFDACLTVLRESGASAMRKHCEATCISAIAVIEASSTRQDLVNALESAGLSSRGTDGQGSGNSNLLCAIIYASTQHLVRVQQPEARYDAVASGTIQRDHEAREVRYYEPPPNGRVFAHPASLMFDQAKVSGFVTYFSKSVTSKPFMRDVTKVPLWGVLLFGGQGVRTEGDGVVLKLFDVADGWARMLAWSRIGALASALRRLLDDELRQQIDEPSDTAASPLVHAMLALLARDGR